MAVDVDLILQSNSLVPFVAIDRAMPNPIDTIYYSDLVLVDEYNGLAENSTVVGNFQAPINVSTSLKASNSVSQSSAGVASGFTVWTDPTKKPDLVKGSVVVTIVNTNGGVVKTETLRDLTKDGKLYGTSVTLVDGTASIDYATGAITITTTGAGSFVITATAMKNSQANVAGDGIMKIRPDYKAVQLSTKQKQMIFMDNESTSMYVNRILANASKVSGLTNTTSLQFGRITNLYTEDVNRDIVHTLTAMAGNVETFSLDMSQYAISSSFSETKNDKVSQVFIDCQSDFMSRTGIAPTVLVVGTRVASVLMNIPLRFIAGPNAATMLNGFIGTFNGIPVYRHNYIDQTIDQVPVTIGQKSDLKAGNFYFAAKLPDNSAGSIAFGEFLPLTKTATALNYNNPMQNSTGWFSQVGVLPIYNQLVGHGVLGFEG